MLIDLKMQILLGLLSRWDNAEELQKVHCALLVLVIMPNLAVILNGNFLLCNCLEKISNNYTWKVIFKCTSKDNNYDVDTRSRYSWIMILVSNEIFYARAKVQNNMAHL